MVGINGFYNMMTCYCSKQVKVEARVVPDCNSMMLPSCSSCMAQNTLMSPKICPSLTFVILPLMRISETDRNIGIIFVCYRYIIFQCPKRLISIYHTLILFEPQNGKVVEKHEMKGDIPTMNFTKDNY